MQTVDKALKLLSFFSPSEPEIGLSELARLAEFDKAATRRFLVALSNHGFIEQNADNRKYRLGTAFLHYARVRETTLPFMSLVQPALEELARATMETAHVSLMSGTELFMAGVVEPQRTTRAYVESSQALPLYATASGISCLAFSDVTVLENYLAQVNLKPHTPHTITSKKDLRRAIADASRKGYGRGARTYAIDVIGTAVPLFDGAGKPMGAVAVAAVASRFTDETEALILPHLFETAIGLTRAFGGIVHPDILRAQEAISK